ncbi:DoxX-like family protein [soil metagenome]
MNARPIYVETTIAGTIDDIWRRTQVPDQHQRWDVRFSRIEYLAPAPGQPQRFTLATTLAPGVEITGWGETLGERKRPDRTAYSGLQFGSNHPLSLVDEGAGFWRYVPTSGGVRFLTRFDYRVRGGRVGRLLDRVVFRPLFGWATAWSFDRLRLWVERRIGPERSRNQALTHAVAVLTLAFVWIYHGLVPKLLAPDTGEIQLLRAAGADFGNARLVVALLGLGEIAMGFATLRWWRNRRPFLATLLAMPVLTVGALVSDVGTFARPFNPLTLNVGLMALATVALLSRDDLPSGRRPLRRAPDSSTVPIPEPTEVLTS